MTPVIPNSDPDLVVRVIAPARLHMGFIDMGGSLGRRFGSIGVGINEIATRLSLSVASEWSAQGPDANRAVQAARRFAETTGMLEPAAIRVEEAIPGHIGLGSGTQMALAVAVGLAHLHGTNSKIGEIAAAVDRGARSGIGIAVFDQGGLIVDGGRGAKTITPPVISRIGFPDDWRFILVLDHSGQGLHGKGETGAFEALPPFPAGETARLCHLLLLRGLPALAEGDIQGFGDVITQLQSAVGDHFAPVQGGRFTSPEVAAAMDQLQALGAVGIGQSSWGPTGFCLVENETVADRLIGLLAPRFPGLKLLCATARNRGAEIIVEPAPALPVQPAKALRP
jgi:beta-RFAP synthase